jgi:asparagine synthase (glutamine-hydrolysing)
VKPFFYTAPSNLFLFASEIKALLAHPMVKAEIDTDSIAEIMLIGPGRTPGYGVFRGIKELPPAHCGFYDRDGFKFWRYWKLKDQAHMDSFEETAAKVRELVIDAIQRQLVSDVPVGTFLSGGLDSSIISSVADEFLRAHGKQLRTFSVDYKDNDIYFQRSKFQPNSDRSYIERMNQYLTSEHHFIVLETDDLVDALYSAVEARDLPGMADIDSSLILFCREIKRYATVALSGECADEIFGGYPWYRDKEIRERYGFPWAQSTGYRIGFLRPEIAERIDAYDYVDKRYRDTLALTSVLPERSSEERRMKEMVNLNLNWFMQTLLDRKDRMSMYNGLEVRVPYCDYRIAEYLYSVPWAMKDYNNQEKGLLRTAMRGILPDEILWRKKSPYPKTHHPEYLKAVSGKLRDIIHDPQSPILQLIDQKALDKLLSADNPVPWYGQLMTTPQTIAYFLQINYWLEIYHINIV